MAHPTIPAPGPPCGPGPGIHAALTAIMQTRRAMAMDQGLTGGRWLALGHALAGVVVVQHGASAVRVGRAISGGSHDRLTRRPGARDRLWHGPREHSHCAAGGRRDRRGHRPRHVRVGVLQR